MHDVRVLNSWSRQVIDASIKVHRTLGSGLLEKTYVVCLAHELRLRGLHVVEQVPLAIEYAGIRVPEAYRLDLLVQHCIVVELKTVIKLHPVHASQLLTYLRLGNYPLGLLINFHETTLKNGIKRLVNNL